MKKIYVYFMILFVSLVSCKEYLEPVSPSEFVPTEVASLRELMTYEVYANMVGNYNCVFLPLLDDDITCAPYGESNYGMAFGHLLASYSWQPDLYRQFDENDFMEQSYNLWYNYYQRILGCNAVLDFVGDVAGVQEQKNLVCAEAYTMRAYYYFQLVNIYGIPYNADKNALGVPLKLTSAIEDSNIPRNTVGECYERVEKDLLEAVRLFKMLPVELQWRPNYRASLPMAELLLSRMYLYSERWKEARDYAESVITHYSFTLLDLNTLPAPVSSKPYFNFHSLENPECLWWYASSSDVLSMVNAQVKEGDYDLRWRFKASDELLESFGTGDLRAKNYIINEPTGHTQGDNVVRYLRPVGKYGVNSSREPKTDFARSLRVVEAYLNSMEAAAMLYKAGDAGMQSQAVLRLEELRGNRIKRDVYQALPAFMNADELVKYIREERRRELCYEDHRWFDLRRYGMPSITHRWTVDVQTTVTYTLAEKDPGYTIPVPDRTLELNKALKPNLSWPKRNAK